MANKKILEIVVKDKATPAVKKIDKSLKDTGKQAKKTGEEMNSAIGNVSPRIGGLINQVKNIGTSFKALAVGAGVGAIAAVGSLFVMATKKGAEFAKQMSTLKAVSGATDIEMSKLSNSAKDLGSSTQFTANEVGELQTEFAKMGFSTKQILASTEATLDLAASLEVGLAEAAMLAGSTVNSFGLEAKDTQKVVDILAKSTSESALDFSSLTEAFKNVAPAAKATNRSVEETSALLAVLANNGIKGGRAGTQLSKAFVDLNKKGIPLNDALDKIKNSSNGLKTAMQLAGERGGKALLVLADKRPQIEALTKSFENSAGAAKEMAEVRLDNLAGDTTKLSSAWEGFLLAIEDGEGLFMSIARGVVQATTSLLNFITPTETLSDSLKKERLELFKTKGELDRLDEKMKDTTLSEEDLQKAQQDRVSVISELKLQYPKYLEDIDAETTSTEDLKKAIDQVNESLVNKLILQEKEEEILEQAEKTKDATLKKLEKEDILREKVAALQQKYADLEINIQETDPVKFREELIKLQEKEFNNFQEGNKQLKLSTSQRGKLGKEIATLLHQTQSLQSAETDLKEEQEEANKQFTEKEALMKRLGIETEETTVKTIENANANAEITAETRDLIKEQEKLLDQAKKLPQSTEAELVVKNKSIEVINNEIKRLKSLGVEKAKQIKKSKEEIKDIDLRIEAKNNLAINEKRFNAEQIQDELLKLQKLKEIDKEEQALESARLQSVIKSAKKGSQKKIDAELALDNFLEKSRQKNINRNNQISKLKDKADADEIKKQDKQWNMLQELQNTAQEQELLLLAQQFDIKDELAAGNHELELALKIERLDQIQAINEKYLEIDKQKKKDAREWETLSELEKQDLIVEAAQNTLNIIGDIAAMQQEKFDNNNREILAAHEELNAKILANDSLTEEQKQQQLKESSDAKNKLIAENNRQAKKAFDLQKKVSIASAIIDTFMSATAAFRSLAGIPVVGPVLGGIAAAAAVTAGMLNIQKIKNTKFEGAAAIPAPATAPAPATGGGATSPSGGGTSPSQPPSFNVVGQSGFNQVAGALGSQPPVQAYVVAGNVTTAQQLNNNTIQQATF